MDPLQIPLYIVVAAIGGAAWICWRYLGQLRHPQNFRADGDEVLLED